MVSVSLHAMFGGYAQGFRVRHPKDRSFKFWVASKSVGFEIYNAGKIVENDFEMVFNLCGFGGPNWCREELAFCAEQDSAWTLVGRNGKAMNPNSGDRRTGAPVNQSNRSVFERLSGPMHVENGHGS